MKSRWIVNLVLLVLVAALAAFVYFRPKPEVTDQQEHFTVSTHSPADFSRLTVEFPAKAPRVFEKVDGYWRIVKPYAARADQLSLQRILSVASAQTTEKFPATDLAQFGLDQPRLKMRLDDDELLFGTYNPVSGEQYIAYKDSVFLVSSSYADFAGIQVEELIDKTLLKPTEKIAGFDFSHLEQWEESRLQVSLEDGKWKISDPRAKADQNEMNEWLDTYWMHMSVKSVEPYTPNRKMTYPSFEVKLQDGSRVHFDKIQEAPEVLFGRPDEGMLYHIQPDVGFTMLNPPVNIPK